MIYPRFEDWLQGKTEYNHRLQDRTYRRQRALELFRHLEELQSRTDPEKGSESSESKDYAARNALRLVGRFSELMAGWAVDHAIGKALLNEELLPIYDENTRQTPEYAAIWDEADRHEHELAGRILSGRLYPSTSYDPVDVRRTLLNVVEARSTILPEGMAVVVIQALRALEHGETLPLFEPESKKYKKKRMRELNAQMKLIEHVEFRFALGVSKTDVMINMRDQYSIPPDTLTAWRRRVKKDLGNLHVEARLQHARNMAFSAINPLSIAGTTSFLGVEEEYGAEALKRDVDELRSLNARKKQPRPPKKSV